MQVTKYGIDGNQVCCVFHDFDCLAVSPAGFGDSMEEAFRDLLTNTAESVNPKSWEIKWLAKDKQ